MVRTYILNNQGQSLMPTTRCKRVRILLETKQAHVVSHHPFTIQLDYETPNITQPLYLGIDPGRTNIGLSVINQQGQEQFTAQVETRNKDIPTLMYQRKQFRNQRRQQSRRTKRRRRARANNTTKAKTFQRQLPGCQELIKLHDIKNKQSRFNNRKRPTGWLTPTANQLLQTHINLIKKIQKFLPITDIAVELNKFSFMKLENPNIKSFQYQQGKLYGYHGDLHQAISTIQNHHCLLCKNPIDHYHHIVPKHKNGSNTIDNIAGLCETHHKLVHTNVATNYSLTLTKQGIQKEYNALSILNQVIPHFIDQATQLFPNHVYTVDGQSTKAYRDQYSVPKDHYLDAYCIASLLTGTKPQSHIDQIVPIKIKQYRRHDRQACHQHNYNRTYYYHGTKVATNRHKALEQKENSLEEFKLLTFPDQQTKQNQAISQLKVSTGTPVYKDINRLLPGAFIKYQRSKKQPPMYFTLKSTKSSCYTDQQDNRYNKKFCTAIYQNPGLAFVQ